MNFKDLLLAVQDENLPLDKIELYRDSLVHLHSAMQIERAGLKKAEALFFLENKESTAVANKMAWRASQDGMRLLDIEAYIRAAVKEIDSLKSRVYRLI